MFATQRLTVVVAVALLSAACGGDGDGGGGGGAPAPSSAGPTTPVVTPPLALTPEEQAEVDIQATFEELIADRDAYYSNAGDYELEDVTTNSPATEWNVTGQAELEMSNWTVLWRQGEVNQVGRAEISNHDVLDLREGVATSLACLDMTEIGYQTYDAAVADLAFEADRYQGWEMQWIRYEDSDAAAGIEEPGWYVRSLELTRNEPC